MIHVEVDFVASRIVVVTEDYLLSGSHSFLGAFEASIRIVRTEAATHKGNALRLTVGCLREKAKQFCCYG
jgi:hypothetical protein